MHLSNYAYVFVIALAAFFLALSKNGILDKKTSQEWFVIWAAVNFFAFFVPQIWVLFLLVSALVLYMRQRVDYIVLYCLMLFMLPNLHAQIPGFGIINYFFSLSYNRLLILLLLVPLILKPRPLAQNERVAIARLDFFVLSFVALMSILEFRDSTFTDSMRQVFYIFLDILVPYYAISRNLKSLEHAYDCLKALLFTLTIVCAIGFFEMILRWQIYNILSMIHMTVHIPYTMREGLLRSVVTFSSPIGLGFAGMIALMIFVFFNKRRFLRSPKKQFLFLTIIAGLFSTISRGPWLATVISMMAFFLQQPGRTRFILRILAVSFLAMIFLSATPYFQKAVNLLPFIGDAASETISYRERLIDVSIRVFWKNPLLGDTGFMETPEMESMRQGQGIIDIVNSYLQIALLYGFIGLLLYCAIFGQLLLTLFKTKRHITREPEWQDLLAFLISLTIGIMVTIGTVSLVGYIPVIVWLAIGFATGVIRLAHQKAYS